MIVQTRSWVIGGRSRDSLVGLGPRVKDLAVVDG